jgi:hypothetical protein
MNLVIARSASDEAIHSPAAAYGMDCFAEPVIRPRFARTGWLAMTLRIADSGCGALRVAGEPREQRFRRILR